MKTTRLSLLFAWSVLCSIFSISPALALDLVPFESEWDYMHPTNAVDPAIADPDFNTTWYLPTAEFDANYNGPAFGSSPAISGPPFDSGTATAPIGYGTINYIRDNYPDNAANDGFATLLTEPAEGERFTAYFRHDFVAPADIDDLALDIIVDDGAAIYIDGVLFKEINFGGEDTYGALTASGVEGELITIRLDLGTISPGSHTIAVSVHQTTDDSSDIGFDLRLSDEGLASAPMGITDFNGSESTFFANGGINGWQYVENDGEFLLDNADGGTISSLPVDLTSATGVRFLMDLRLDETSGNSNFEASDSIAISMLLDFGVTEQTIILTPFGYDANQDGAITGDEVQPDVDTSLDLDLRHTIALDIPDTALNAVLEISAINNSTTEMFRFSNARFTDNPTSTVLGSNLLAPVQPSDIVLLAGPNAWVEDAAKQFSLNDADANGGGRVLASEVIDLSIAPAASVSLNLTAKATSLNTNFEDSDTFAAWVEVLDSAGLGSVVQLVNGGNDADGNHVLAGDEFTPGADPTQSTTRNFTLAANLPADAQQAQIFIAAEVNAGNEFLFLSDVTLGPAFQEPTDFGIVEITRAAGTSYDITFESSAGSIYQLQFSPDNTAGSFADVGAVIAGSAGTTTTNHDPGVDEEGFYRVQQLVAIP